MNIITILLLIFLQLKGFDAVKIGMKDTKVEQLLGYPEEIYKGFTELAVGYEGDVGYHLEKKGQLNYTCWKYGQSITKVMDTVEEDYKIEKVIGKYVDTNYAIINGKTYWPWAFKRITDTIYFYDNSVITKQEYYVGMELGDTINYKFTPVKSKKYVIDSKDKIEIIPSIRSILYSVCYNRCVLFDPSSNRVVDIGYYPTEVKRKVLKSKKSH